MISGEVNDIGTVPRHTGHPTNRGHMFGSSISVATIILFGAPNDTPHPSSNLLREQTRMRISDWIVESGAFDTVIDLASIRCRSNECDAIESGVSFGGISCIRKWRGIW